MIDEDPPPVEERPRQPEHAAADRTGQSAGRRSVRFRDPLQVARDELREVFSTFYRQHLARLIAYLMYLGARPEEAAECAQDTMIKALGRWWTLTHPYAWCRTTAAREYFRRRFGSEEPFDEVPATGTPLIAAGTELEDFEQRHRILSLLRQLPSKQRQVMALTFDGATPAEIAADLSLTSDQVRSNLRLARRKLAACLQDEDQNQEGNR